MCTLIKSNLDLCRIEDDRSEVIQAEASDYLHRLLPRAHRSVELSDIVFFDPPYASDYFPILDFFGSHSSHLLTENGVLIVEHHHKNELQGEVGRIIRNRLLKQGDSALSFYQVSR
jgi:16S rRNA G966 N2-methylase RsmD